MSNYSPITPPPELVEQWVTETWHEGTTVLVAASDAHIATQAARWGADQELKACEEWVEANFGQLPAHNLHQFRRPKPPSLKEQALAVLDHTQKGYGLAEVDLDTIRRALEALDD